MDRAYAEKLLSEAKLLNDGAWIQHSYKVAALAEQIAKRAGMDSEKAYIFGLLHDIGRRNGNMQARHALEGYYFLESLGLSEEARICMTHTFQYQNADGIYDEWDCTEDEKAFVKNYLQSVVYDAYDKLIQLCDALTLADTYCVAEQKMVNSVLRFGFKETTLHKWRAILDLKAYFDRKTENGVYNCFENK